MHGDTSEFNARVESPARKQKAKKLRESWEKTAKELQKEKNEFMQSPKRRPVVGADVESTVSAGSRVVGADVESTVVGADVVPEACNTP